MTRRARADMDALRPIRVERADDAYPSSLARFLGADAPERVFVFGSVELLNRQMLALFCSIKCPGNVILKTYDLAKALGDASIPVIGGFHTPMERECLDLLLRGTQPVIICPARGLERMRLSPAVTGAIQAGRGLLVSPFEPRHRRATADLAARRNRFVAALATSVFVSHAAPGGKTEALCREIISVPKPLFTVDCAENANLLALGARPLVVEELSVLRDGPAG